MKNITLILLLFILCTMGAYGQGLNQDSLSKANTARADAEFFKLNAQQLRMFRQKAFPPNSDYFKPTLAYTSNPSFINDSVYVNVFKNKAYQKVLLQKKRTLGHKILVGVGIYYGVSLVAFVIFIVSSIPLI
ncbi:MAG: hypothetical protein EAY66_09605 [Sphingobacteriales bacterium]|jgi:hypothetical protein|nr:MAG: hypothetical protein EAY66_09605 [Sphingobacteriales bacterium]